MLRCSQCQEQVIKYTALQNWFKLVNFFHIKWTEGEITAETYEDMVDALQTFKEFAYEQEERACRPDSDDTVGQFCKTEVGHMIHIEGRPGRTLCGRDTFRHKEPTWGPATCKRCLTYAKST